MANKIPLDVALTELGRADPTFYEEVKKRLAPVKHRFFETASRNGSDKTKDGETKGRRPGLSV